MFFKTLVALLMIPVDQGNIIQSLSGLNSFITDPVKQREV